MQNQLFIPDKIKVGYQERSDTYTKKLAYIIYYDAKGVLRKENSWEGWRDKKIDPSEVENVPTEGFVLNKKAGGYSSGWNHRQSYIRVYDPRGFEFEITPENLLFILQEANSIKGKGLEGEFVYSWSGKDLVLIPATCEEYKNSKDYSSLQNKKISARDLVQGVTYLTKNQENLIYIGRYEWFDFAYENRRSWDGPKIAHVKKQHIFQKSDGTFIPLSSMTTLADITNDIPVDNFAEIVDEFYKTENSSSPEKFEYTLLKDVKVPKKDVYSCKNYIYKKVGDNEFKAYYVNMNGVDYDYETRRYNRFVYHINYAGVYSIVDNVFTLEGDDYRNRDRDPLCYKRGERRSSWYGNGNDYNYTQIEYSKEEIENLEGFHSLKVVMKNGNKLKAETYS